MKVEIAGYSIDCAAAQISRHGEPVLMPNRDAALLFYLLRHAGNIVDKSELRREVWGQRLVEDSAIHRAVSQLRNFFSDSNHRLIRTAARRGYMLVLEPQMLVTDALSVEDPAVHVAAIHVNAIAMGGATIVADHLATELATQTAEVPTAGLFALPQMDRLSKPKSPASTKAPQWTLILLILASCLFATIYIYSQSPKPNSGSNPGSNTIGVQFSTGDVVERNLLLSALIDAGRRLQPQVQFHASAETNDSKTQLLIALIDAEDAGAALQFRFGTQAQQTLPLLTGARGMADQLAQTLAAALDRRIIALNAAATGSKNASQEDLLLSAQLDFRSAAVALSDRLLQNNDAATTAQLAFALNELGTPTWPLLLAADALQETSKLDLVRRCLTEYVLIDAAVRNNEPAVLEKYSTATFCGLAQARKAEAEGNMQQAADLLAQPHPGSILLSMKQLELQTRVDASAMTEPARRKAFEQTLQMARSAGWRSGLARIYELKGDYLFGAFSKPEAIAAYDQAEMGYLSLGDALAQSRVRASRSLLRMDSAPQHASEARELITQAEHANDYRSALIGWIALMKHDAVSNEQYLERYRQLASKFLLTQKHFLDPALIVKFCILLESARSDMELDFQITTQLVNRTSHYPGLYFYILPSHATAALNVGYIAEALLSFDRLQAKQADGLPQTWSCVAGFAALEGSDYRRANTWFKQCAQLQVPVEIACVPQFGDAGLLLNAYARDRRWLASDNLARKFAGRNPKDPNCVNVALLIGGIGLRAGNAKLADAMLQMLRNDPRISAHDVDFALLQADFCLAKQGHCQTAQLRAKLTAANNLADRALLTAKLLQLQAPNCELPLQQRAQALQTQLLPRQAPLLTQRLRCALAYCTRSADGNDCPQGQLGLY